MYIYYTWKNVPLHKALMKAPQAKSCDLSHVTTVKIPQLPQDTTEFEVEENATIFLAVTTLSGHC